MPVIYRHSQYWKTRERRGAVRVCVQCPVTLARRITSYKSCIIQYIYLYTSAKFSARERKCKCFSGGGRAGFIDLLALDVDAALRPDTRKVMCEVRSFLRVTHTHTHTSPTHSDDAMIDSNHPHTLTHAFTAHIHTQALCAPRGVKTSAAAAKHQRFRSHRKCGDISVQQHIHAP